MPGWSPEIANEFIRLSVGDRAHLNQLQLQELVYIAHGWRLALSGAPLTGDRPEASETGPMYRRLASALADYGLDPVLREITGGDSGNRRIRSDLDQSERDLIGKVYQCLASFESWQLSALTRKGNSPWKQVFADGAGRSRDIPHKLVEAQFVEFFRRSDQWSSIR